MKVVPSCWSKGYFSVIPFKLTLIAKKINKIYIQLQTCTSVMHEAIIISYRSTSIVSANGVKHVQWNLYNLSGHLRECCSAHLIQSVFLLHTGFDRKCHMRQTCQLSQFCRESHDFLTFLTVSWQDSQSHGFLGNILHWNITLLNKNINFVGKFLCLDKLWLF